MALSAVGKDICLVSFFLLLTACVNRASRSDELSVGVKQQFVWSPSILKTCIASEKTSIPKTTLGNFEHDKSKPFSSSTRQLIFSLLNREFTATRTGVYFSSLVGCDTLTPSDFAAIDVVIYRIANCLPNDELGAIRGEGSSEAMLGDHQMRGAGPLRNQVSLALRETLCVSPDKPFTQEEDLENFEFSIVHEAGHIVGMRHTHTRYEATLDPQCYRKVDGKQRVPTEATGTAKDRSNESILNALRPIVARTLTDESLSNGVENPFGSDTYGLPYDPDSIMNYCRVRIGSESGKLSSGDVKLLRRMYGLPEIKS